MQTPQTPHYNKPMKVLFLVVPILSLLSAASLCEAAGNAGLRAVAEQTNSTVEAIVNFKGKIEACSFSSNPSKSEEENHCQNLDQLLRGGRVLSDIFFSIPQSDQENRSAVRATLASLDKRLLEVGRLCYSARFSRCYYDAKKTVSLPELQKMFTEFTKDKDFRYSTGYGACHFRAEALAFTLAEKGFAANTIRIHRAPTLIAMDRTRSGELTGGYYDYHGWHTLIQIMVKDGELEVPYLLDPQFMNEPLPRDEYFLRTMGQICNETDSDQGKSFLNCYFSVLPQNFPSDEGYHRPADAAVDRAESCGWTKDPLHKGLANLKNGFQKSGKNLQILNDTETPARFANRTVNEGSARELILHAYENYEVRLKDRLQEMESRIARSEANLNIDSPFLGTREERQAQLEAQRKERNQLFLDIPNVSKKLAEVRKNMARY